MNPPNVLLIVTDQQRADHVGFGGNSVLRTPNLDALAARGSVFDRCYVANPICMPNRSTMLTGRVPSAHGVIFNDRSLAWTANTFPRVLRGAGYATALIGKSHIQHGTSRDVVREWDHEPPVRDPYPAGWNEWEHHERYEAGPMEMPEDFYGFGHVEFTLGHGDMVTGHHYRWAIEKGADPSIGGNWGPDRPALARYDDWWQVYQPAVPEELYSTTFVTDRTADWIENAPKDTPWFVQCSFPDPHHPFTPPGRWWDAYEPDAMSVPETIDDPLEDAPSHLKLIQGLKPGRNPVQMFGATPDRVRHARAAEYGMLEMIDSGIGQVLAALERSGAAENTIVIFTSDHGDMFGDHGLMLKGWMHYQGVLRVPLVIARPGQAATRTRSLASTLDLAQTVLELCGCEPFRGMQGTSLGPILDDPEAKVRDHVYIEDDFPNADVVRILPARARSLVTDEGRITRYSTGEVEVFDLEKDPDELTNLAAKPAGRDRREHLADRLIDAMLRYQDTTAPDG
jgi:arylsulfatase A-like enzyme